MSKMKFNSILNDVLGPVMRGPSSSHTAGSYHIGLILKGLLTGELKKAEFFFDPAGSYAQTYREQLVDKAFIAALTGSRMLDDTFMFIDKKAAEDGYRISFTTTHLPQADHPNYTECRVQSATGEIIEATARSTGGGTFIVSKVNGFEVQLRGKSYELLIFCDKKAKATVDEVIPSGCDIAISENGDELLLHYSSSAAFPDRVKATLLALENVHRVLSVRPVYHVKKGAALFHSAEEMVAFAEKENISLGKAAELNESHILALPVDVIRQEMLARYLIMKESVISGLQDSGVNMQLMEPVAGKIYAEVAANKVAIGGIHSLAAARAMAAMHACNSHGIVCAAPTGGSAGTIPGVIVTLAEEKGLSEKEIVRTLFAAGAIGLIFAERATFAAEVAGCQVEIGAAGAMAAALVVEWAGGSASQACDAAAIALQNTMGSVCDLVQGFCEIPCHTRNAVAASSAFVCADLILGGYYNHIGLDETVDAVYSSGKMMPPELRCTAKGGLALAPSALAIKKRR